MGKRRYFQSFVTDIGVRRKTNQDSILLQKAEVPGGEVALMAVCDGMGGYSQGELASRVCVLELRRWFKENLVNILWKETFKTELFEQWMKLVTSVNKQLVDYGVARRQKLGTTLTAFLFVSGKYYALHIGDSRGYRVNQKGSFQITEDQSFVAAQVRRGYMTYEEALVDSRRSKLLETVGVTPEVHPLFYSGEVGDAGFLICSDGFWHCVTEKEMIDIFFHNKTNSDQILQNKLEYLVSEIKKRGEKDNISVIAIIPSEE